MQDIPDDIMRAAREAAHRFLGMAPCYPEQFQLQDAIALAIAAERERCQAATIDAALQAIADLPRAGTEDGEVGHEEAYRAVEDIRKGKA